MAKINKCPKCGSTNVYNIYSTTLVLDEEYKCKDCGCWVEQYQERVEKVLSRFDFKYENDALYIKLLESLHIVYFIDKFYLRNNGDGQSCNISLKTVESLLEDLGGTNE